MKLKICIPQQTSREHFFDRQTFVLEVEGYSVRDEQERFFLRTPKSFSMGEEVRLLDIDHMVLVCHNPFVLVIETRETFRWGSHFHLSVASVEVVADYPTPKP